MTTLSIPSFDGRSFEAYVARPAQSSAPAILVIQEIFGINAAMRQICDELAQQGYLAVCPDLFWRQQAGVQLSDQNETDIQTAYKLFEGFNVELGVVDLLAALSQIRQHPVCNGAVGTVGYCLGGKLAFLMMARSDVDCGVSYYGVGLEGLLSEVADIRRPLLMHVAENDKFVPPAVREKILRGIAKNQHIGAEIYPGVEHAFARPQGVHYDAGAAALAQTRTTDFFATHLRR